MSFFIQHPDEWIGVPEHWPFEWPGGVAADPVAWINELAETLPDEDDLDGRQHVQMVLALAAQRGHRTGLRTFVAFASYSGPAYIVESGLIEDELRPGQTLLQYAGLEDPAQVGPPFAEEFVTASGLVGARCYRYLPREPSSNAVYGRADYVFKVGRSVLFLRGAEHDLIEFERLKPLLELLASSVSWRD